MCSVESVSYTHLDVYKRQLLILIHVATQHVVRRDVRKVVEWDRYGPALSRRLPDAGPLETFRQVDEAVVSAIDASSRMKPGVTPHWQRIPEETSALACERNRLRRRWQRTRDPADKAAYLSLIHI